MAGRPQQQMTSSEQRPLASRFTSFVVGPTVGLRFLALNWGGWTGALAMVVFGGVACAFFLMGRRAFVARGPAVVWPYAQPGAHCAARGRARAAGRDGGRVLELPQSARSGSDVLQLLRQDCRKADSEGVRGLPDAQSPRQSVLHAVRPRPTVAGGSVAEGYAGYRL
jgi:hypothetical protein